MSFKIQNVVASADINQKIDLETIKRVFVNVDYKPKRFPGLVFRLRRPKTAILIFRTGKLVCTGAKSEKLAKRAVRRLLRKLKEEGFIIRGKTDIRIQNIVSTADMYGRVDLEMAAEIMDNVMYEPDQFPGLILRMNEPKVVILVFASGKVVITGARTSGDAKEAAEKLSSSLREYDLMVGG